jgi:hypoxanthine phosphoribosyltransferase
MSNISFLPLSWDQFHQDVYDLAQKVQQSKVKFDRLAAISRGGLVTARMLSDFLDLPISTFTMVAYKTIGQLSQPKIVEDISVDIKGETVLLVDEIVDSGSSFEVGVEYLAGFAPEKVMTLAPYIKPIARFKPDFWQMQTDKWVIFPYEVRETIKDVTKLLQKEGKSEAEIHQQLHEFGFKEEWVLFIT